MGVTMRVDEVREFLGTHGEGVLATVNASGAPVPLPVWYIVVDDVYYVRTPRTAKRLRHIARDPRVSLVVHAGGPWRELRGVLVSGTADVVRDDSTVATLVETFNRRFAALLPPRLPGSVSAHYDVAVILRIAPARVAASWDNRKVRI